MNTLSGKTRSRNFFHSKVNKNQLKIGIKRYFISFIPFLSWIAHYPPKWIINDVISGLTVSLVLIPQCLAYARLANVPLQYGLTSSFIPPLLYTFMGTCRELSVGPTAVIAVTTGKIILELVEYGYTNIEIASSLAFWSGLIILVLGVTRLGKLLDLIPDPVILGFINGAALNIATSQLPKLLGLNVSTNQSSIKVIYSVFENIGSTNVSDLVIAIGTFTFLLFVKFSIRKVRTRWDKLKYVEFAANGLAVFIFTLITYLIMITNPNIHISIIGAIPNDLSASLPNLDLTLIRSVGLELIPLCLVIILEHVALAKGLSKKFGYVSNLSQELVAVGASNMINSFFYGIPVTGSLSRSSIQSQAGVQSPLSNLITSGVVLLVFELLTPLFYYLPLSTLSAMIILAALRLLEGHQFYKELYLSCPSDLVIFLSALTVTFAVDTEMGILVSIILAFLKLVYYLTKPYLIILSDSNSPIESTTLNNSNLNLNNDQLIFQPQLSLNFLNAQSFGDRVLNYALIHCKPPPKQLNERKLWSMDLAEKGAQMRHDLGMSAEEAKSLQPLRGIIIDFIYVQFLDFTGIRILMDLRDQLQHIYSPLNNELASTKLPFNFVNVKTYIFPQLIHSGLVDLKDLSSIELENEKDENNQINQLSLDIEQGSRPPPSHTEIYQDEFK